MGKLHELLAVEETVVQQTEKLLAETSNKFNQHSAFFTGGVKTLTRLGSDPQDRAMEQAARSEKQLPTTIKDTLGYVFPFYQRMLEVKLSKHLTDQTARADIVFEGKTLATAVPVDFLLELEKQLKKLRAFFEHMPTLDPSLKWEVERDGVMKVVLPDRTQTEKIPYAVVLSPATDKHPAQVKEATKDVVVGLFHETAICGAATTQQKADVLTLCDRLYEAVRQARMRANDVEQLKGDAAQAVVGLFKQVFEIK